LTQTDRVCDCQTITRPKIAMMLENMITLYC